MSDEMLSYLREAFHQFHIELSFEQFADYPMPDGKTNQFVKVKAADD